MRDEELRSGRERVPPKEVAESSGQSPDPGPQAEREWETPRAAGAGCGKKGGGGK